jgi:hypothetical protein
MNAYYQLHWPAYEEAKTKFDRDCDNLKQSGMWRHVALQKFDQALEELLTRALIARDRTNDTFDLHPVVRACAKDEIGFDETQQSFLQLHDQISQVSSWSPKNVKKSSDIANALGTVP